MTFSAGKSGRGAIKLLRVLHKCDEEKALRIAVAFLRDNLGTGSLSGSVDADEDAAIAEDDLRRTTEINEIWQAAQPIDGSPAETYLKSRGLDPDRQDRTQLRQLKEDRPIGYVSMLAAITASDGSLVAMQATRLTAEGKKADVHVVRRTTRGPHDWNVRGLVRFGNPRAKKIFICEGVEDALSILAAGADCVYALTGLARLPRINLPAHVEEIVVVTDDDGDGTPASEMLWRGIVGLLGNTDSRVNVSLTPKPAYAATDLAIKLKDVNDLLQHDAKAVKELLASATSQPRGLSDGTIDVILDAMSRLDAIRWQRARERIVKLLGWKQVAALDKERAKRIATRAATDEMDGGEVYPVVVPWEEPVTDLGAVLDELVEELGRYMSASLLLLSIIRRRCGRSWRTCCSVTTSASTSRRVLLSSPRTSAAARRPFWKRYRCCPEARHADFANTSGAVPNGGRVPPHVPDRRGRYPDAQGCSR